MKFVLFTDPHLGLKRTSHTTSKSQALLRDELFEVALSIVSDVAEDSVICLGDLFDQHSNDEATLSQGMQIASRCDFVLAGNHDVSNRSDKKSSLELLHETFLTLKGESPIVISPDPVNSFFHEVPIHGTEGNSNAYLFFVPHCFTQDVFAETVRRIGKLINERVAKSYIFLHCNVGNGYGSEVEDGGSTLWLTEELYQHIACATGIYVGHEHTPSKPYPNVHVLGNTYPVSFGEIADRYKYILDTDTGELEAIPVNTAHNLYAQITCEKLMEVEGELTVSQPLIEVTGNLKAVEYPSYARSLMKFWKTNPELQAVKNSVVTEKPLQAATKSQGDFRRTLTEIIEAAVEESGFAEEYKEVKSQVTDE